MWKRYHFSVEVCEKGIAIPLGGTSLYKTSLSTPAHFWGWNRLIRAKNQLSSIKPTYIQVCWFPGSSFVPPASSCKCAAKLSVSSIYSWNSLFFSLRPSSFIFAVLAMCSDSSLAISLKNVWIFSPFPTKTCFLGRRPFLWRNPVLLSPFYWN